MSRIAWIYVLGIISLGLATSGYAALQAAPASAEWLVSLTLTICAIASLTFRVVAKRSATDDKGTILYSPHLVFLFAGVMLLSPLMYVMLVLISHLIEWLIERVRRTLFLKVWYIQPFNMAGHVVCGFVAQGLVRWVVYVPGDAHVSMLIGAMLGVVAYVLLNHSLVGVALWLARGISPKESQLFAMDRLLPDFIMLLHGFVVAVLWRISPLLIAPGLAPLVLIQHAVMLPQLRKQAQTDDKTGLVNAGHFKQLLSAEFVRATRFDRPLAVVLGDLDLFRDLNNEHGHLAGDKALKYVGEVIRTHVREYDIASRFGGEEFVIALPETSSATAMHVAEAIRGALEAARIDVGQGHTAGLTISLGVAQRLSSMPNAEALIDAADKAMYFAKHAGRNQVVLASQAGSAIPMCTLEDAQLTRDIHPAHISSVHPLQA